MRLAPLPLLLLWTTACGADSTKSTEGAAGTTDSASHTQGPSFAECRAWLDEAVHAPTRTVCDQPVDRAMEQLATDQPRSLPLSTGRTSIVWLPDDWDTRSEHSVLVLIHGSMGCPEDVYGNIRLVLGDTHALVSLDFRQDDGSFLEADQLQADLDETASLLANACPVQDATWLMYGLSRGGMRAIQLGGLDRMGPQRLSGVVSDSGTGPNRQFEGIDYGGARYLLWCGEHDPDPVQEGRTACAVMQEDLGPFLERQGAEVDAVLAGEGACHGIYGWDCAADCSTCDGLSSPGNPGPHASEVGAWLDAVAGGG